jgi:hypothetical protein
VLSLETVAATGTMSGIPSEELLSPETTTAFSSAAGISSEEALSPARMSFALSLSGVVSEEVFAPTVTAVSFFLSGIGISSEERLSAQRITVLGGIAGIASEESLPDPVFGFGPFSLPGISSDEVLSSPNIVVLSPAPRPPDPVQFRVATGGGSVGGGGSYGLAFLPRRYEEPENEPEEEDEPPVRIRVAVPEPIYLAAPPSPIVKSVLLKRIKWILFGAAAGLAIAWFVSTVQKRRRRLSQSSVPSVPKRRRR